MSKKLDRMTKALSDYMGIMGKFRALHKEMGEALKMHPTINEWIYEHGKFRWTRAEMRETHPHSKQCYDNAYRLFMKKRGVLAYCEGYVQLEHCPIPVMHGWCVNKRTGEVLDPSVANEELAVYIGVQFKDDFAKAVWKRLRAKRAIGILPNLFLLREDDKWLNGGIE